MLSSTLLSAVSLLGFAAAIPAAQPSDPSPGTIESSESLIAKRNPPADSTAPWVQVNDEGQPETTYTPSATLVDGTTSIQDAAPHDLTASVYTETWYGEISTRTGDVPNPQPTGKKSSQEGAFTRCYNLDGKNAPFCAPSENSVLYTDSKYYVTWDPDFYNTSSFFEPKNDNRTLEVSLRLDWYNTTTEEWNKLDDVDGEDDRVPAIWGYFPFKASSKYNKEWQKGTTNLTITLITSVRGSKQKNESESALPVTIQKHFPPEDKAGSVPKGQTLYIALPAVFGSILLLVVGGCLWNRKTRRIQLGNVMGRRNKGYTGRSTRRMFRPRNKDNDISLDVRPIGGGEYHDDLPSRPGRGSDELGSLAGTPVEDRFRDDAAPGNAFRDEIQRQERQRGGR